MRRVADFREPACGRTSAEAADAVLASGTLTKRDQETIKFVISGVAGCD
jgi:hypothetical protein